MKSNFVFSILDYISKHIVDVLLIVAFLIVILIFIVLRNIQIVDENDGSADTTNGNDTANSNDTDTTLDMNNAIEGLTVRATEENISKGIDTTQDDLYDEGIAFCKVNEGETHIIEEKCNTLHSDSCKSASCCVLAHLQNGKTKCMAGSKFGPTYLTDEDASEHNLDKYYYLQKCYGETCE